MYYCCIVGGTAGVRGAVVLRERADGAGGVSWDGADGLHPRGPLPRLVTDQHADHLAGPALQPPLTRPRHLAQTPHSYYSSVSLASLYCTVYVSM